MFTATLIGDALRGGDLSAAVDRLAAAGCAPQAWHWLDEGTAADLTFNDAPAAAREALEGAFDRSDVVVQPTATRRKRLIVADMDSTMITVECIDELADYAGIKAEVAAVTEAAMRGELDFEGALDARVALLKGLDEQVIARCLAERVHIMPGAKALIGTMRANGADAVLVSGGFTRFAEPKAVADRQGPGDTNWWFTVADQETPCFAGLWKFDQDHDRVYAFCTTEPHPLVAPKHPKAMPVILLAEDQDRWLTAPVEEAVGLLTAYPSQLMGVS